MKSLLCRILAVATLLTVIAIRPLRADDDEQARSQVLALERLWNQAYKAGDTKALASILDSQLVLVEDDGSLRTKADFLSSITAPTSNEEQVAPESLTVRVFGNTAIAIGVIGVKAKQNGKVVTRRERFIDTWIKKNGTWVCIATDATPMTK
ncbi:MAG TPA: nuclear transport factor 2 family protein [Terriglobales bacterium]|nr:nuclear transport factor 2 family protein [Terriglobales bacterium]